MSLFDLWEDAVASMEILHLDPTCEPVISVLDAPEPRLSIAVLNARDTARQDRRIPRLEVATVRVTYWPGETLAKTWLAIAWSGYIQHAALELVFADHMRVVDPHVNPELQHGLRLGFPAVLTPETLANTLEIALTHDLVVKMILAGGTV